MHYQGCISLFKIKCFLPLQTVSLVGIQEEKQPLGPHSHSSVQGVHGEYPLGDQFFPAAHGSSKKKKHIFLTLKS